MGGKSKAESPKKPPRRKLTAEEQHALFVKTARELGVDETGAEFERAFDKVASAPTRLPKTPTRQSCQESRGSPPTLTSSLLLVWSEGSCGSKRTESPAGRAILELVAVALSAAVVSARSATRQA